MKDRRNEFVNNNLSLCEFNCEYKGYYSDLQKAECECEIKIKLFSIKEITINKEKLYNSIMDINDNLNLYVMKCYKRLFKKDVFKNNIGFYILLFIILSTIVSCVLFLIKGHKFFANEINKIFIFKVDKENIEIGKKKWGRK